MAKSVLITGCSRGIGLEMVKQLVTGTLKPQHLFATCRNVDKATELLQLAKEHPEIHLKALDITDESAYSELVSWVEGVVGADGLNMLINNAGILKQDNLDSVTSESLLEHYKTNTIAPLMLTKAFYPLLKKAAAKLGGDNGSFSVSKAAVINISTKVASIEDNTSSNVYSYRMSKAALNMASKNLSIDLQKDGILVALVHPGWVRTEMGGARGLIDAPTSVKHILETVFSMKKEHIGAFLNYNGDPIPW